MALGVAFGLALSFVSGGAAFIGDYIKPFGTIFINLLKLIAIPLILASPLGFLGALWVVSVFLFKENDLQHIAVAGCCREKIGGTDNY